LEVLHIGIAAYHCQVQEILAEQGKFFDMKTWLQKQVLPHLHSMVPNDQAIETLDENHFPSFLPLPSGICAGAVASTAGH